MKWHDDADNRKRGGDKAEKSFAESVHCFCGGEFKFINTFGYDFTCENCGQLVDVKSSPQAEKTGNIAVSAVPWSKYSDDLLIAIFIHGEWIGEYKKFIRVINSKPYDPAHHSGHKTLKNTEFHLISWRQFKPLKE